MAVLAKHGFQNILERAKLGKFILEKFSTEEHVEKYSVQERLRMSFEELGPTFIKLGQLLATRPDLIPSSFAHEFKQLHDNVHAEKFEEIEKIIQNHFPKASDIFLSIDEKPLAAASIAQVHAARLRDGTDVVLKIRRPKILKKIKEDLNILYFLANLIETSIPELRIYNPKIIVDEFFKTMELETNFLIEANNILRFRRNFANDPSIKIPQVYLDYCSEEILVMEMIKGIRLSQPQALKQEGVDPAQIAKKGMKTFFKMVFQDKFFHGDLHAGNIFIMPNNQLGIVDFGVVGRLSLKTRDSIANMFVALAQEDYEALAEEFAELSQNYDPVNTEKFARDLRDLIAPYFGLTFKNINTGKLLMDSASLAARYQIQLPAELMLFFKSIVTVEGMGREIVEDFDVLSQTLEIASEIIKAKYDPQRVVKDLAVVLKDSATLLKDLPKQLQNNFRKRNLKPQQVTIAEFKDLEKAIHRFGVMVFLGLVISSLIIAAVLFFKP